MEEDIFSRQWAMFSQSERETLRDMTVFVGGAGGLGTHQLVQLQRIGVDKIYLIDRDVVEPSNLNRQILYGRNDVGKYKVNAAAARLDDFRLDTELVAIEGEIDRDLDIPEDVDIILDALDNFPTRFVLDELAHRHDKPLIHGAVESWLGQLTSIIPGETPSLQDILGGENGIPNNYSTGEDDEPIPVFSPVVSTVANLQVIEAVKVHLGREDNLSNQLLLLDLKNYSMDRVELQQSE